MSSFDAAPKIEHDFLQHTSLGACVSIVSVVLMVVLFFTEVRSFWTPELQHELQVVVSRGEMFQINVDVTFPRLPCSLIALDVENRCVRRGGLRVGDWGGRQSKERRCWSRWMHARGLRVIAAHHRPQLRPAQFYSPPSLPPILLDSPASDSPRKWTSTKSTRRA